MKKHKANSGWSATTQLLGTALWRVGNILDTSGMTDAAIKEARVVLQDVGSAREESTRDDQLDATPRHSPVIVEGQVPGSGVTVGPSW